MGVEVGGSFLLALSPSCSLLLSLLHARQVARATGLLAVLVWQVLSPWLSLASVAPLCAGCVQLYCLLRGVLRVASYASRLRRRFRQLYYTLAAWATTTLPLIKHMAAVEATYGLFQCAGTCQHSVSACVGTSIGTVRSRLQCADASQHSVDVILGLLSACAINRVPNTKHELANTACATTAKDER